MQLICSLLSVHSVHFACMRLAGSVTVTAHWHCFVLCVCDLGPWQLTQVLHHPRNWYQNLEILVSKPWSKLSTPETQSDTDSRNMASDNSDYDDGVTPIIIMLLTNETRKSYRASVAQCEVSVYVPSCGRCVATYWKEQTRRSQNCKYLP